MYIYILSLSLSLSLCRYAVVTGSNKGIGLEISRQLASKGVTVVMTARDEKRGLEAVEKLKASGLSDSVMFHQLDVSDQTSIASFAQFLQSHIGKLDILTRGGNINWSETYDRAIACLQTNYYGAKRTTEALLPLLHLSALPRIVNVSSSMSGLKGHECLHKASSQEIPEFSGKLQTDMSFNTGVLTVEEGAEGPVMAALLPDHGPSGVFFVRKEVDLIF
ncbi:Rossmann-fold superfamily protein [Perilla frutescens var. frutescens]|nr:Rossmann-fold superfamily protein [Perilla frutescens var. frutescens]